MSSNRMGLLIGSLIVASISSACQGNLPDQDLGQDLTAPVIVASHETSRTSAIKAELGQDSVVRWNASTNKPGTVFAAWQPQG